MDKKDAIEVFTKFYEMAMKWEYIKKPISWALYRAWKYFNAIEKEKKGSESK